MPETAGYLRVSTTKQDDDRQRQAINEEVEGDWTIYADIGSGAEADRPDYQRLRHDIKAGEIDTVVTWEISRLSRSLADASDFIDLCIEHSVELRTLADMFPDISGGDDVMDKMMAQFTAWMMEFEREMIRGRVISGVQNAINEGKWVGRPPVGFHIGDDGRLVVDPSEFLAIQTAVQMVREGTSQNEAAERLDVPQSSLSRIINDDEKRRLYEQGESYDERIEEALPEQIETSSPSIEHRVSKLEEQLND
jgi:DNA invertase Pin-like site-specific DNA recombinase